MSRLHWFPTLVIACAFGCTGSESDDDGTKPERDAGFRDAGPERDAGFRDAGPGRDAGIADAGMTDGGSPDGGSPDGGDPCGPIPRAQISAALAVPLGRLVDRCVSELDAQDSAQVGGWYGGQLEEVLRDTALVYNDVAAGLCLCDLDGLACDTEDPFRVLSSCAAVVTGTIAEGDSCTGQRCEAGLECWHRFNEAPPSCEGVCVEPVANGGNCESPAGDPYPCQPGYFCFDDDGSFSCEPLVEVGDSCSNGRRCRGDDDAFLFETTFCNNSSKVPTCEPRGRLMDDCSGALCHDLYVCDSDNQCVPKPRNGDACALPFPNPTTSDQFRDNARVALDVCMLNPTNAMPGGYCVVDNAKGDATCQPAPLANDACGIGVGLAAACGGRSICSAIDPGNLGPVTGTCMDPLADGAMCNSSWFDEVFGNQCLNGECDFGDPSVCAAYNPNGICIND